MNKYPINLTRLIHENLSVVMNFAYSRQPLAELLENEFIGEWEFLWKSLFEVSEEKANRAITELAVLLRILDDEEKITDYQKQTGNEWNCGKLELENKKLINLTFREFSNKIIHSETFSWEFKKDIPPRLICYARQDEKRKWNKAFVDLAGLAGLCGQFMS